MRGTHTERSAPKTIAAIALAATSIWVLGTTASPAAAHTASSIKERRQHIAKRALSQLGTRYSYGSESPTSGFDCSGLTYWTFKGHGATLARSSIDQWGMRDNKGYKRIWNKKNLKKGDLLFWKTGSARVGHVGIFLKGTTFVHSSSSNGAVRRDSWRETDYYRQRFVGAVRVPALRPKLD